MKRYGWMVVLAGLAILLGVWLAVRSPDKQQKGQDIDLEKGLQNIPLIEQPEPLPVESFGTIAASTLEEPVQSATASLEVFDVTSSEEGQVPRKTLRRGAYQILGSVISIAQAPVDGATVVCRERGPGFFRTPQEWTVTTDNGGEFAFYFRSPGRFELDVWKSGYTRGGAQVELTIPGPEVAKVILRPGNVIQGTVKENFTGQLLAGANVWASAQLRIYAQDEMRPQFGISTQTASDGSYLIEGLQPDQVYTLVASDGFHSPEVRRGVKPGGVPVDFLLNPGAQVSGRVIWEGDQSPVEGAQVGMGFGLRPSGRGGARRSRGSPRGPGGSRESRRSTGGGDFKDFLPFG